MDTFLMFTDVILSLGFITIIFLLWKLLQYKPTSIKEMKRHTFPVYKNKEEKDDSWYLDD